MAEGKPPLLEDIFMCAETISDGMIVRRTAGIDYQVSKCTGPTSPLFGVVVAGGPATGYTRVVHFGHAMVLSGAAFAEGDRLTCDAAAKVIKASGNGDNLIGYALEAATGADQVKEAFICLAGGDGVLTGSASGVNPASLTTGTSTTTSTITVTGAALGDAAWGSFSLDLQGILLSVWVSAANTVGYRFCNFTGGTIDLASGTVRVWVRKT
jgi:hypothetical protein